MRSKTTLLTLLAGFAATASAMKLPLADWSCVGNEEFRAAIDKLAGKRPVDCGLVQMIGKAPDRAGRRKVLACVADATRRNVAFKFGTSRVPLDSFVDEVYVRTESGEAWMLVFDVIVTENEYSMSISACDSIEIDAETLYLDGKDCEDRAP